MKTDCQFKCPHIPLAQNVSASVRSYSPEREPSVRRLTDIRVENEILFRHVCDARHSIDRPHLSVSAMTSNAPSSNAMATIHVESDPGQWLPILEDTDMANLWVRTTYSEDSGAFREYWSGSQVPPNATFPDVI
jgi:hypothetical protein